MIPTNFPEANKRFGPPPDLDDSQCGTIDAFVGEVPKGNLEGSPIIVTAWRPTAADLEALNAGGSVFIGFVSYQLPPHIVATDFASASQS